MSENGLVQTPSCAQESLNRDGNGMSQRNDAPTSNSNHNRNRGQRNRNVTFVSNHAKEWKGECEDIGLVLGIRSEKLNNQTLVKGLLEKLEGYMKKNLDHY